MDINILLCETKFNIDTDDLTKKHIVEIEEELDKSRVTYKYCIGGIIVTGESEELFLALYHLSRIANLIIY